MTRVRETWSGNTAPRFSPAARFVLLRVFHQPRVLFCEKKFLGGDFPVAAKELSRFASQLDELLDDCVFARFRCANSRGITILLRLTTEMIEARIAQAGAFRRVGIYFLEIIKDRIDRGVQTVKIHSIKSGGCPSWIDIFVEPAQPLDELDDDRVAPHPGGKTAKTGERFTCIRILTCAAHVTMDASCVRPVRLNR